MEQILFESAKGLLEIGKKMKNIDPSIADMILFLSDRIVNIAEVEGFMNDPSKQSCDCQLKDVSDLGSGTQCNGHSANPMPITDSNVQQEVSSLVEQIRSESSKC
jgi:hypothetical protein